METIFAGINAGTISSTLNSIYPYLIIMVILYFVFLRPQQKKQKEELSMRSSIQVGDAITTIGGVVGIIVSIDGSEDDNGTIVVQTGDSSRITFRRGAIRSKDTLAQDKENTETEIVKSQKEDK